MHLLTLLLKIKRIYKQLIVIFSDIIISYFSLFFTFYILISDSILSMPNETFIFILVLNIFFYSIFYNFWSL